MGAVDLSLCNRLGQYVASQDFSSLAVKVALPAIAAAGACAAVLVSAQAVLTIPLAAGGIAALSFFDVYFHGNGKGAAPLHFLALRVMAAAAIIGGLAIGWGLGIAAAGLAIPFGGAAIASETFWTIVLIKTVFASYAAGFPMAFGYRILQAQGQVSDRFEQFKDTLSLIRAQVGNERSFFMSMGHYFFSIACVRDDLKEWQRPDIAFISRVLHRDSPLSASAKSAVVAQAFPFLADPEKEYFLSLLGNNFQEAVFQAILPPEQAGQACDLRYFNPFGQPGADQDRLTVDGAAELLQNLEPQRLAIKNLRARVQQLQDQPPAGGEQIAEWTALQGRIRGMRLQLQQLRAEEETEAVLAQIQHLRQEIAPLQLRSDQLQEQIRAQQAAAQAPEQEIADLEAQAAALQGHLFLQVEPVLRAWQRMRFRLRNFVLLGDVLRSAARSPAVEERIYLYNGYTEEVSGVQAQLQQIFPALERMRKAAEPLDGNAEALNLSSTTAILTEKGLRDRDAARIAIRTGSDGNTFRHLAERFAELGITSRGDLIALGIVPAEGVMPVDDIVDRIVAFLSSPARPLPPAAAPGRLIQPPAGPQSAAIVKVQQAALFVLHYAIAPLFVVYQTVCNPVTISVGFVLGLFPFAHYAGYFARQYLIFPDYTGSSIDGAIRRIFLQTVFALVGSLEEEGYGVFTGVVLGMRAREGASALYHRFVRS